MPQATWSAKRERQFQHIKSALKSRGGSRAKHAEEIAARTVNKERAQHGEAKTASPSTLKSTPAPRRGGLRSHRGAAGRTYAQLYKDAQARNIPGRSTMNKAQLERALGAAIKRTR
ncbi:MAG: plasmid stabilization protein [Oxalicibacterium faecigallinarum]|uniref:Plasmid stabilization protein n=1 Tax=Oxalicibacterium faecigallinarum TaxID=573741 RepID=A0A8J3AZ04_9BURK|nr:plasmid stabilization protein [Oxalicibacterium faecigallinarum]MDQ7968130.1 plasmid stabilization protein [Oxalicibacterium faecigallinarum]GGI19438.1 hypothetical protein GCM10008066_19080 [Oxalicibacterium faecigallinarum]